MNGRKTIAGLCMLCALLASAVAAQSASAISGTTVFTCKQGGGEGGATFAGSHCKPGEGAGEYGHYKVAENTTTELAGHTGEVMKLKTTLGGQTVTFSSTSLVGTGSVENKVAPSGEHYVQATSAGIFKGVTVSPFTKCFVYKDEGGAVGEKERLDTEEISTTSKEQGDAVKFTPVGEALARFWVLDKEQKGAGGECAIQGTYTVTGSVIGSLNGATFAFNHAAITAQNTLKIGGVKAGVEGSIALEGRDKTLEESKYTPLSVTTVTT